MRSIVTGIFLCLLAPQTGCAGRSAAAELIGRQSAYYAEMRKYLRENRGLLETALLEQLAADREGGKMLLAWQHDLRRAQLLIGREQGISGQRSLLFKMLAELDLDVIQRSATLTQLEQDRLKAQMTVYDAVIRAAVAIEGSSATMAEYLGGEDTLFTLGTLDINVMVAATAAVRHAQEQLGDIEKRTKDQRRL